MELKFSIRLRTNPLVVIPDFAQSLADLVEKASASGQFNPAPIQFRNWLVQVSRLVLLPGQMLMSCDVL